MMRISAELMPFGMGSFVELMPFGTGSFSELLLLGIWVLVSLVYAFCMGWVHYHREI